MVRFFETKIEFLKGVGPQKAALLNKELSIFTYGDLIQHYPFRYEDRTQFHQISQLAEQHSQVQLKGKIQRIETIGLGRKQRLVAHFKDDTGQVELVWFKAIKWIAKSLRPGAEYVAFGKPSKFSGRFSIVHPEIELLIERNEAAGYIQPVYHSTEKLKFKYLDSKALSKLQVRLVELMEDQVRETLPADLLNAYKLASKQRALHEIHFPKDAGSLKKARFRLKFEELFFIQLQLLKQKLLRIDKFKGKVFNKSTLLTEFYHKHLPFELTNAQKKVIKEIYADMGSGSQMNRLLQGDVGSGKTVVAFICMLVAISNGTQAALMAPTEILADQHYRGLKEFADKTNLTIVKLTGSSKKKERTVIHEGLLSGAIHIIIGTHALLEDVVQFKDLGLTVIDEQHRFGVAQRAKLWTKNKQTYPHILVMTATPIPRTLAMTLYGDLDISIIDELPAGRKPIKTIHSYDKDRLKVLGFIKKEIDSGRQVYIVYPLIEESEKLDLKDLQDGYESICRAFPKLPVSIVHGRMKPADKDFEMQRFVRAETKILVATTVIEVGVNVPNATVMVIENAERFGLAQLHQLRGRVGRGAEQSYCILMSDYKLSKEGKTRLQTMVRTNNGFEIADVDLKLRGPGDIMGTQQSGVLDLLIADLSQDQLVLQEARHAAQQLLQEDPLLTSKENAMIKSHIDSLRKSVVNWSRVS